jgi:hypothetical protein
MPLSFCANLLLSANLCTAGNLLGHNPLAPSCRNAASAAPSGAVKPTVSRHTDLRIGAGGVLGAEGGFKAQLWQAQGRRKEAYKLLAGVYGWFTEGSDTVDLA